MRQHIDQSNFTGSEYKWNMSSYSPSGPFNDDIELIVCVCDGPSCE